MDYEFVQKYMEPKRTGNIIRDLNPMSKLNLMLVLGLSPFIVQNYIYGFGMVLFFILVSAAAGCFRSFFSMYWKVLLLFGVFLFLVKAAFAPGEHVLFEIWGICITKESMIAGLDIVSLVLAFSGGFILFVKTTPMEDFTYMLEQKGVSHMVSFVILSSFQTITDLGQNAKVIMESQKARGIETEGNVLKRAAAYTGHGTFGIECDFKYGRKIYCNGCKGIFSSCFPYVSFRASAGRQEGKGNGIFV